MVYDGSLQSPSRETEGSQPNRNDRANASGFGDDG